MLNLAEKPAIHRLLSQLAGLLLAVPVWAAEQMPVISIVIDDMGYRYEDGLQALKLPGDISYSFLPHTPYAGQLAELAAQGHRDVLLHIPMQPVRGPDMGPGGLTTTMSFDSIDKSLTNSLASVPHVIGINNHMGSLLTSNHRSMDMFMRAMSGHPGLFYLDSRTTTKTVAPLAANTWQVPFMQRDVFLDTDHEIGSIRKQIERLIEKARTNGSAIAIAHPHHNSLQVLAEIIPTLKARGIELVDISELYKRRQKEPETWQLSLSHLPRDVKN